MRLASIWVFLLFLFIGIAHPNLTGDLLFPYSLLIPKSLILPYRIMLIVVFLVAAILLRRNERYSRYWPVALSFLIFSFSLFLDWYLTIAFGSPPATAVGIVTAMVLSTIKIVLPIIVLIKLAGFDLSSVYLKKGNLKLGLTVGFAGFIFFVVTLIVGGNALFYGQSMTLDKATPLLSLGLIFVFSNGLREELLYRGLFLKNYQTILGRPLSNLLQCLIFTWSHTPVTYTADIFLFIAIVFSLSLIWGYLIQRSDGLWGSLLFHAGGDLSIFLGMAANL